MDIYSDYGGGYGDCSLEIILAHSIEESTKEKVRLFNNHPEFCSLWLGEDRCGHNEDKTRDSLRIGWHAHNMYVDTKNGKSRLEFLLHTLPKEYHDIEIKIPDFLAEDGYTERECPVCIFPHSVAQARSYLTPHWFWVYDELKNAGHEVAMIMPKDRLIEEQLQWQFMRKVNTPAVPNMLSAITYIKKSKLVLGVDSGPAHIAGLLNKPFLALLASISGKSIYKQYNSINTITSDAACSECHFLKDYGYKKHCHNWCMALNSISPKQISTQAINILNEQLD